MPRPKKSKYRSRSRPQILALGLIGAGLLVLGALGLVLIPKPGGGANSPSGELESQFSTIPVQVDFDSPALTLQDLDGSQVSLADFRDSVVLVNNWATWCPPCKAEMPTLQAFFEEHRRQHFTIIAIEAGETTSDVARFVKQYGLTFHVWPDPAQKSIQAFRNMSLPNSYVIDRGGKVRLAWTGEISREILEQYVTPLLEE
jgi:peroxiredoxin